MDGLSAEHSFPVMRVNDLPGVLADPHLEAVGFFASRPIDDEVGGYLAMAPGIAFSATPMAITRAPPRLGQHSAEILQSLEACRPAAKE